MLREPPYHSRSPLPSLWITSSQYVWYFPFVLGPPISQSDTKRLSLFSHYDSRGKPVLRGCGWHAQSHTAVSRESEFKSQPPDLALGLPPLDCGSSSGRRVGSRSLEFSQPLVPRTEVLKERPWPLDQYHPEPPRNVSPVASEMTAHVFTSLMNRVPSLGPNPGDNPFHNVIITWPPHRLRLVTPQHPSLW